MREGCERDLVSDSLCPDPLVTCVTAFGKPAGLHRGLGLHVEVLEACRGRHFPLLPTHVASAIASSPCT